MPEIMLKPIKLGFSKPGLKQKKNKKSNKTNYVHFYDLNLFLKTAQDCNQPVFFSGSSFLDWQTILQIIN